MSKNLYVDMDGTLAVFNNQIESEKVLFQEGYYLNLPAQQRVVEAVRLIMAAKPEVNVFTLSAVLPSPYAKREKNQWLNKYLPELDQAHRIFVPCGEDKGRYIGHTLGEEDLLLDDYSKNLHSWCPPGRAVKLMNQINGRFGTWKGAKIDGIYQTSFAIANQLLHQLHLEEIELRFETCTTELAYPEMEAAVGVWDYECNCFVCDQNGNPKTYPTHEDAFEGVLQAYRDSQKTRGELWQSRGTPDGSDMTLFSLMNLTEEDPGPQSLDEMFMQNGGDLER